MTDTLAFPILTSLLDCLCANLADTVGGAPCWCGIEVGNQVAMDYCDCAGEPCGKAYIRLDSVFPTDPFPRASIATQACAGVIYGVRVQVGVYRCIPGMDAKGRPPSPTVMVEAARSQTSDMAAVLKTVLCCPIPGPGKGDRSIGAYTPVGSSGNCGGGFWTATYRATSGQV